MCKTNQIDIEDDGSSSQGFKITHIFLTDKLIDDTVAQTNLYAEDFLANVPPTANSQAKKYSIILVSTSNKSGNNSLFCFVIVDGNQHFTNHR